LKILGVILTPLGFLGIVIFYMLGGYFTIWSNKLMGACFLFSATLILLLWVAAIIRKRRRGSSELISPAQSSNRFAICGMVLGVASLALMIPLHIYVIPLAVSGMVLSGVALWQIKKGSYAYGKGISIVGLVCGCIALVFVSVTMLLVIFYFNT